MSTPEDPRSPAHGGPPNHGPSGHDPAARQPVPPDAAPTEHHLLDGPGPTQVHPHLSHPHYGPQQQPYGYQQSYPYQQSYGAPPPAWPHPAGAPPHGAYPPAPPERRSRRVLWISLAVLLVVALVAGGISWWWLSRDDDDRAPAAGMLDGDFAAVPASAWTVTAADFGGTAVSKHLVYDDSTVIVGVGEDSGSYFSARTVVGIDLATGDTWTLERPVSCRPPIIDHRVLCASPAEALVVDTRDGSILDEYAGFGTPGNPILGNDAVYVSTYVGAFAWSFSAVTPDGSRGLGDGWYLEDSRMDYAGPSISEFTQTDGMLVLASMGTVVIIDPGSGDEIFQSPGTVSSRRTIDGRIPVVLGVHDGGYSGEVALVSRDGVASRFSGTSAVLPEVATGWASHALWLDGKPHGIGGEVPGWRDGRSGVTAVPFASESFTVIATGSGLTVLDSRDGTELWSTPATTTDVRDTPFTTGLAISDGTHLIWTAPDGTTRAADLRTGDDVWSLPRAGSSGASDYSAAAAVFAPGGRMVVLDGSTVTAYG